MLGARRIPTPKKRHMQREIHAPVEIPLSVRERLHETGWTWAEKFARNEILDHYRPKIATALAVDYLVVAGEKRQTWFIPPPPGYCRDQGRWQNSWNVAQSHIKAQHRQLQLAHLRRAFDEQEIRDYADNYSRMCSKMERTKPDGTPDAEAGHARRVEFVTALGIKPPEGPKVTIESATRRMDDAKWWRRQLRVTWTRRAENVMRTIGIVRRGREAYASDDAVHHRRAQKERGRKFLEKHVAVSDTGEQLSLWDLHEGSVSNPALRRGEFMCRVRGFEETADAAGHVAQFWTLTTPSEFHAQLAAGVKNPKYNGASARDGQEWLCKQWSRARAKLKRLSTLYYGVRVAEPHHDGTPHWHLLLWCRQRDAATVASVIRGYWVNAKAPDGDPMRWREELGSCDPVTGRRHNEDARCKLIVIDRAQGSAVGYVAKYVAKNIDGAGSVGPVEDNETGAPVIEGVARVDAWASLHGIRQFQQIGGPPVGLWRELRRMTEASTDPQIESVRAPADVGDWATFIRNAAFEGIRATRRQINVRLARKETGELTTYAEEPPPRVVGVSSGAHVDITRPHMWRIQPCADQSKHGENGASVGDSADSAPVRPWSRGSLHPFGGICGLRIGDSQRRADECAVRRLLGLKTKKRKSRSRAQVPAHAQSSGADGAAGSGSSSRSDSALGPVAITVRGSSNRELQPERPARPPPEPDQ